MRETMGTLIAMICKQTGALRVVVSADVESTWTGKMPTHTLRSQCVSCARASSPPRCRSGAGPFWPSSVSTTCRTSECCFQCHGVAQISIRPFAHSVSTSSAIADFCNKESHKRLSRSRFSLGKFNPWFLPVSATEVCKMS